MYMKRYLFLLLFSCLCGHSIVWAQNKIVIPDTDKHVVLTGDMHIHTIFSDGNVWPTTRVEEAYAEGVEVICITDHLDHRHKKLVNNGDFNGDRNYSYDVAAKLGEKLGVIVIKGAEISRGMPPGHFNTLFISDVEPIAQASDAQEDHQKGMLAGLAQAKKQDAFCVWNHPHWYAQQPKEVKWHPEHEAIFKKGYMHGIEVYNSCDGFSMEAFQWALDRNMTIICGTDVHTPMFREYNFPQGELRPVTLIFAKEKSKEGIHEALENRRTAIFADGCVYGSEELLTELVDACLKVDSITAHGKTVHVNLKNTSSIPFVLKCNTAITEVAFSRFKIVQPFELHTCICRAMVYKSPITVDEFTMTFEIDNFYIAPGKKFSYSVKIQKPE